jgi:hypothetical protein
MVEHDRNPSTQEAEAEGPQVQDQPRLHREYVPHQKLLI